MRVICMETGSNGSSPPARIGSDSIIYVFSQKQFINTFSISQETLNQWYLDGKVGVFITKGGQRRFNVPRICDEESCAFTIRELMEALEVTRETIVQWQEDGKIVPILTSKGTVKRYFVPHEPESFLTVP